nr:ATP-binding protein [Algoriphagus sp.]
MKDISAEKIYKQTLLESERKFKGIFNSTFQFIGFLDLEGNLLEANQTALDFGGLRQEDVVGKKFWDCHWWQVSPQTQKQLQDAIQMAAKGEFVQYEVAVWDRDKRPVTILFNLKPIFNEEGKVFAIIPEGRLIQDIVDAREALKDKNLELQRFASVASHDLKEPLRMVINFLQLLHRKYDPILDDKGRQYIQFAVDASQRMNTLISELLEYSQLGNLDTPKEWVDTNSIVQTVLDYYSTSLEESGGRVYFSSLPNLWVRKVPFELLIRNLLGNSLKYRKPEIPPQITLSAMELENHWEFAVRDNGIGFEPEHAKSIFQMFKRLHTRQEFAGTGMGLATCQRIVEQHDGEIWAESIPGQGSVFRFTLAKPDS